MELHSVFFLWGCRQRDNNETVHLLNESGRNGKEEVKREKEKRRRRQGEHFLCKW